MQEPLGHNAVMGPQRSASGSDAPTSPSRWRRAGNSFGGSQEGSGHGGTLWRNGSQAGGSVRGGGLWHEGSGGELGSACACAGEGERQTYDAVLTVGMNRAAHVGAVAGALLEFVRWDLLPDAPPGVNCQTASTTINLPCLCVRARSGTAGALLHDMFAPLSHCSLARECKRFCAVNFPQASLSRAMRCRRQSRPLVADCAVASRRAERRKGRATVSRTAPAASLHAARHEGAAPRRAARGDRARQ